MRLRVLWVPVVLRAVAENAVSPLASTTSTQDVGNDGVGNDAGDGNMPYTLSKTA